MVDDERVIDESSYTIWTEHSSLHPAEDLSNPQVSLSKSNTQHPDISVTIRFLIKANQKNEWWKNQPNRRGAWQRKGERMKIN